MEKTTQTYPWALILLLGSLMAFDPLSIDMYLPAFDDIERSLSATHAQVELSLSSFFIGLALGQLLYGPLSDKYGRKMPLALGMCVYILSSFACAFAPTIEVLIASRFLQALGGCAGMVITRAIVRDMFDKQRSAQVFSLLMLVMGLAPILAPLIGGYVNKFFGWRVIFMLLGSLSAVSLIISQIRLPETQKASLQKHPLGHYVRTYLDLFKDRKFLGFALAGGAVQAGMFAYITGSPFIFINLFGVAKENYGLVFGANAIGLISASQLNGYLLKKYSVDFVLGRVLMVAASAATVLFLFSLTIPSFWTIVPPLFFFVMNLGLVFPNAAAGALAHQGGRAGTASALLGTLQFTMAALSAFFVSYFHNGTALPMTGLIFCTTALSLAIYFTLVRPRGSLAG